MLKHKLSKKKLIIISIIVTLAVNTLWYFFIGHNIPLRKSLVLFFVFASLIYKITGKQIIIAGAVIFLTSYLGILIKNYYVAERIADLGYFIILYGVIVKFIELLKANKTPAKESKAPLPRVTRID